MYRINGNYRDINWPQFDYWILCCHEKDDTGKTDKFEEIFNQSSWLGQPFLSEKVIYMLDVLFIARHLSYFIIKFVSKTIEFRGKIDNLVMK